MTRKRVLALSLLLIGTVDAFEPTELANCVIWLQAGSADIQTNPASGRVSTWLDRSGNNNHAFQTDTNRQPLYVASGLNSLPALHFDQRIFQDGYAAGLLTDKALTSAFSVFVVTRVVDDGERGIAWRRIVPSRDMNWLLGTYTPGTFYAHAHTGELSGPSARLRAPYQIGRTYTLSAVNTTSEQRFYVNGYDLTGDASRTTPPGRLTIGGAGSTSADPSDALIAEVIVYERALPLAEREQVETYLKTRYAVSDAGFDGSVWSGLGAGNLWSEAANWQQPLPTRPMLAFNTDRQTVSVNDLTGLTVDSIMVWDRDITVSGNPVTLENNFFCVPQSVVNWALETDLPAGLHTFSVRNSRRLTLSGRLSGAGGICLGLGLDYAGTLDLACPTNSFTGPVRIKSGIAVVSRLAPGGTPSSLGAASGEDATVHLGNLRYGSAGGLRYTGTEPAATDREFRFLRIASLVNDSPADAGITFSGALRAVDETRAGSATLELGGTSRGVNIIQATLGDAPLGGNPLAVTVKGGVWRFSQPHTFTGGITLEGGTVILTSATAGGLGQGRVSVKTGATLGGTGVVTSTGPISQFEGAILSPGDPDENGGIGCLTYDAVPGLSGVRLVIQTTLLTNDSIRINAAVTLPAFLTVDVQAASAAECPASLRIIEAADLTGAEDLSGWEITAPCSYRAVRDGTSVLLVKQPAFSADAWQRKMLIRFPGYTGTSVLTNFPALIKLSDGTGNNRFHYADCAPDGADLLFTDVDGTPLHHDIERWDTHGESCVWVKLPQLTQHTEITAHWMNPAFAPLPATFRPTDLPGCALWLDAAASFTTDGDPIATWPDLSGNNRHATQGTAAAQPRWVADAINGLPAARFEATGTKDGMVTGWSAPSNSAYTVIVAGAFRNAAGFTWRRIVQGSSGYNFGIAMQQNGTYYTFVSKPGGHQVISSLDVRPSVGAPFVGALVADGTHVYFALNGFTYPAVAATGAPNVLGLGVSGHSGDGWDGDVLEVVAYNRALSPAERQQVEHYLAEKYDALSAHLVPAIGLRQWLRADMVNADILDGGVPRVSKAENQTPTTGMHATQSVTNRMPEKVVSAIHAKPALRFDALPDQYDSLRSFVTPVGNAYTAFVVFSPNSTGTTERVIMQGYGGVSRLGIVNGILTRNANGTVSQLLPCPPHQPVLATLRCNELSSSFYVNGVNLTQNAAPAGNWSGGSQYRLIDFGAGYYDGTLKLPMDGDLAEVLLYDRILSDRERQRVEAYLAKRYAIPANCGHAQVWSDGYAGVWHLTDTARLLLADASPAQNGAVLLGHGEARSVPAWAAHGLAWDTTSQFGRSRTATDTPSTLSFWVLQTEVPAAFATVIAGTSGAPYVALNNAAGQLRVATTDAAPLLASGSSAWTQYAVVVNPASQVVQAYGNGEPLATVPGALGLGLPTGQALTFGHDANTSDSSKTLSGALDELRISTTARSADWIRASYRTQAEHDSFTSYNRFGTLILMR